MTSGTHQTDVMLEPDIPLVRITRQFDAAPARGLTPRPRPPSFGHATSGVPILAPLPRSRGRIETAPGQISPKLFGSVAQCSTSRPVRRTTSLSSSTPTPPSRTEGPSARPAPRTNPTSTGATACSFRMRMPWATLTSGYRHSRRPFPERTGVRSV